MFEIKEVKSDKDRHQFVKTPFVLYKGDPFWIPPIKKDEFNQLKPETNPSYEFCDAKFWIACKDRKCIGRIGAIVNHNYNEKIGKKMGRIARVEFIDDDEVSAELFKTAENWLKEKGMEAVHGPLGFNNLDIQGLLIEGFDYLPSIASTYYKPFYKEHFEKLGYTKENDWVEFRLTLIEKARKKASRGGELIKKRYGFEVLRFNNNREIHKYTNTVFKILNEAFQDLPYVSHFNDKMIEVYSKKYFKVLNPKFVRIVKKDEQLIAFIIGIPSLSRAMQKANGKLFPLGFYHILKALRKPKLIDLILTGVLPEYHNAGAAVVLFAELQDEMMKQGIDQMETTGIFETNHNVISNWKNYGHIQHKRRRCYVKQL
ncbi:MAG: hypothetical protein K8R86_08360 [Bacteroidales bacterium]|nr:hypothetical protein [Bacteroidales bacterium]